MRRFDTGRRNFSNIDLLCVRVLGQSPDRHPGSKANHEDSFHLGRQKPGNMSEKSCGEVISPRASIGLAIDDDRKTLWLVARGATRTDANGAVRIVFPINDVATDKIAEPLRPFESGAR